MKETRQKLIDAIIDLSGDEFESMEELKSLAKEDIESLVERIVNIAEYYRDQYNNAI